MDTTAHELCAQILSAQALQMGSIVGARQGTPLFEAIPATRKFFPMNPFKEVYRQGQKYSMNYSIKVYLFFQADNKPLNIDKFNTRNSLDWHNFISWTGVWRKAVESK